MIPLAKLAKLSPRHRMRKMALVLEEIERGFLSQAEGRAFGDPGLHRYLLGLSRLLVAERDAPAEITSAAARLARACDSAADGTDVLRAADSLRHLLLTTTGQAPADWDLLSPLTGRPDPRSRTVLPGLAAYLEDLRSPFNVGSVFRTADAFGLEELVLSPGCAEPSHPRAQRSAMGAVELLPWRRAELDELPADSELFALELGGEPISTYSFPDKGIVLIGSEELGLSRDALGRCTLGTVSIPMSGAKASLNVAVAFGILMYAWTACLRESST